MSTIHAWHLSGKVFLENSEASRLLFKKSCFGSMSPKNQIELSLFEAIYLLDDEKIQILDGKGKKMSEKALRQIASKRISDFWLKYPVFSDLRSRGYIVKTALKFGADFRVYEKGKHIDNVHSKWVVSCVSESKRFTWYEFAAKNRVAHSTKKKLLIAIVDDESDVSYWESSWIKP